MHPKIDREEGLAGLLVSYETKIAKHAKNLLMKQLIRALHLPMKHNAFCFGTSYYRKKDFTSIRDPPATDCATQTFAFY